jgi:alkylated DNA repair dioxygenase AlkB
MIISLTPENKDGLHLMDIVLAPPIAGLRYAEHFLTPAEQSNLLDIIDSLPWHTDHERRLQHYGWRFDYSSRRDDPDQYLGLLPVWAATLAERLKLDGFLDDVPDQLVVNEYQPGQGLGPHIDCIPCFGEVITTISLGGACVMDFTSIDSGETYALTLEPGSLLVLSGDARYRWEHGIAARKSDGVNGTARLRTRRVTLTFRHVTR